MKKIYRYAALVCASAAVAISCVEENLEPIIPAVDGDGIVFGVRAGFEDSAPQTRTEYSGEDYTVENPDGTTTKFERIDWVVNDKIEIYSPQAENPLATTDRQKSTHYVVTNLSAEDENAGSTGKGSDYAKLANVGEAGLRWNSTQPHDFYAMYPSSEMFRPVGGDIPANIKAGVLMGLDKETSSKVMVYGIVSAVQQPTVVEDPKNPGNYIAKPDMNNAYMVAKTSVDPTKTNQVNLSFVPIVTAVEIELVNIASEAVTIREIQVASDEPIVGGFTADLSGWTSTYPECTNLTAAADATAAEKQIQVTTVINSGDSYTGVILAPNATLKFTVFLLPGTDIENLIVRVSSGYSYLSKNLNNANIPANLKTRIKQLNLPGDAKEFESSGDNWMAQLDPESVIKSLSLPGTGGSFTSTGNSSFRQQELTFDQQWSLGVRAFELSSDRPNTNSTSSSANLGAQSILCNKAAISGWTVASAIKAILNKVTSIKDAEGNLTETAALILTYQPIGNSPNRDIDYYASALKTLLTAGSGSNRLSQDQIDNIIPYTTDLTLDGARGKLILICRPSQKDENNNGTFSNTLFPSDKVTAIDGCGTAKDRWGARGYKAVQVKEPFTQTAEGNRWGPKVFSESQSIESPVLDISNEGVSDPLLNQELSNNSTRPNNGTTRTGYDLYGSNYIEYYMSNKESNIFSNTSYYIQTQEGRQCGVKRPNPSDPSELLFGYETNQGNTICWFQEWARVVPEESEGRRTGTWRDSQYPNQSYGAYDIYWFESYNEKLANVKTTFDMAIGNYNHSYIYINSLCGYFAYEDEDVDPTWSLAPSMPGGTYGIWGGAGGNIRALSNKLNPAFQRYVEEKGLGVDNSITGPTGIVLMDFVMKAKDENGNDVEGYNSTEDLIKAIIGNNQKYATTGPSLEINPDEIPEIPVNPF